MPMKITRQRSAGLFGTAAASVWVRPVFGESYEAAEWFNRLIGASTSQRLGEGKTFRAFTTPLGCIRFWEYPMEFPQEPEIPIFGTRPADERRFVKRCKKPGATPPDAA